MKKLSSAQKRTNAQNESARIRRERELISKFPPGSVFYRVQTSFIKKNACPAMLIGWYHTSELRPIDLWKDDPMNFTAVTISIGFGSKIEHWPFRKINDVLWEPGKYEGLCNNFLLGTELAALERKRTQTSQVEN